MSCCLCETCPLQYRAHLCGAPDHGLSHLNSVALLKCQVPAVVLPCRLLFVRPSCSSRLCLLATAVSSLTRPCASTSIARVSLSPQCSHNRLLSRAYNPCRLRLFVTVSLWEHNTNHNQGSCCPPQSANPKVLSSDKSEPAPASTPWHSLLGHSRNTSNDPSKDVHSHDMSTLHFNQA